MRLKKLAFDLAFEGFVISAACGLHLLCGYCGIPVLCIPEETSADSGRYWSGFSFRDENGWILLYNWIKFYSPCYV